MTNVSQKRWVVAGVVGLVAVIAAGAAALKLEAGDDTAGATAAAVDAGPRPMTDEERKAYVAANVRVSDVVIGPNLKPGTSEPVPGLLEVAGNVHNQGEQPLTRLSLSIFPEDATGNVLGAYLEDLAKKPLAPGESRKFRFLIPEKKEFAGKWKQELE